MTLIENRHENIQVRSIQIMKESFLHYYANLYLPINTNFMRLAFDFLVLSFLLTIEFCMGHVFNAASMILCYAFFYAFFELDKETKRKVK